MKIRLSILVVALLFALPEFGRADAGMTPDQIKQLYTDGKFKEAIVAISKALAVKGPDAGQYDHHDLLLLKGEASLRSKQKSNAQDAFKQAAAAATDPKDIAIANATSELIKQSSGTFKFQPKTKSGKDDKPAPIDIVEPESRKLAFAAMEADMEAVVQPKVDAALKSTSLAQVAAEAKDPGLGALAPIEIAATGSATESTRMLSDLGHHAYALMDSPLDKLIARLNDDVNAANNRNKPVTAGQATNNQASNAASSKSAFLTDITNISNSAKEIGGYATSLAPLFGDTTDLKPIQLKVSQIDAGVKGLTKQVNGP